MALFAIKDILPNPFRHISRYPIRKDKIAALRESLRTTGFWANVVARSKNGKAEIAYGHHRLVALKEEYGPSHKVELILRKLNDDTMLQIMARENMEEWGTSAAVEHETIRATVEAYSKDKITLPPVNPNTPKSQIKYAPSFVPGEPLPRGGEGHPYTAQTLAEFIGWLQPDGTSQQKVLDALTALQFIEEGLLKEKDFEGLTTKQAQAVVEEARKARNRREALARVHRLQAEQAEREARAAEQRREEAERERRRKEAEAAAARDTEARHKATEEAKHLAHERREAEEARRHAVEREKKERQKERASIEEGRRRAVAVGRAVSTSLKAGKIGYKQAADVAAKVEGKKTDGPPPYIEDYAKRLASDLNMILDPDRDQRVKRLRLLVEYREYLNDYTRADLARTLEVVANRVLDYAKQFSGSPVLRRALPASTRR